MDRIFFPPSHVAVTEDSPLVGMWSCVIRFEFIDVSDQPVAFILNVACRTTKFLELARLTLENDSRTIETLRSVNYLTTFRENLSVPSSGVKPSRRTSQDIGNKLPVHTE